MSRTDVWIFVAAPLFWLMLDRLTMGLIDDHLLSSRSLAAIPLLPGIIAEAPTGFWKTIAAEIAIWFCLCNALAWLAVRLTTQPLRQSYLAVGTGVFWIAIICQAVLDRNNQSDTVVVVPVNQTDQSSDPEARIRRIGFTQIGEVPKHLPDVLIIVLESFRHELVDPDVMPNLAAAADQGLWCRQHFSGGNATSHGMFSIVTGMDATWFDTSLRYQPPLYRLFRSAGYEIGFFAGHNDWRKFYMDGFVNPDLFDEFSTAQQNRLSSDRESAEKAMRFLDQAGSRSPRLAILYLYVTHAPYRSYAADRVFQPAAEDGFPIPYSERMVTRVWNRYKNSARTADRWIGAMIAEASDQVLLVTGDHGESFLEDGTIGHGSKISTQQNMTPAVLIGPGVARRQINSPTIHSDFLPTLISAVGIKLSMPDQHHQSITTIFDGFDLNSIKESTLIQRTNVTRDYLTERCSPICDPSW
jgi:hypothetical protein